MIIGGCNIKRNQAERSPAGLEVLMNGLKIYVPNATPISHSRFKSLRKVLNINDQNDNKKCENTKKWMLN